MGPDGLRAASELAVLNANYIMEALKRDFELGYDRTQARVRAVRLQAEEGERRKDARHGEEVAGLRLPRPTVYSRRSSRRPYDRATETESKETLDEFICAMKRIAREAEDNPENLRTAPHTTPVGRLDETLAARKPILRWKKEDNA